MDVDDEIMYLSDVEGKKGGFVPEKITILAGPMTSFIFTFT